MDPNTSIIFHLLCGPGFRVVFVLQYFKQAEELSLSGSIFTVRFPASSGTLLYDPTLELTLIPDDEDEFWRHPWFVWTTASFGALVSERIVLVNSCRWRWRWW